MAKYRKKPVVIDAERIEAGIMFNPFIGGVAARNNPFDAVVMRRPHLFAAKVPMVKTLEGWLTVSPGDWIIRGVNGELYPCKPDIFAKTYEPA